MIPAHAAPLAIALLGLLLGMRHATDPDHVIAVTTILSRERRLTVAARIGVVWGTLSGGMESYDALNETCRGCHQPYWAYALPKTEQFSYRLLGTVPMLACLTAEHEPAGLIHNDKTLSLDAEPFQLRDAYVLEMTSLIPD